MHQGSRTAFLELARRSGDFAMAGVAAVVTLDQAARVTETGLAGLGVGGTPIRLEGAEAAIMGQPLSEQVMTGAARAASGEVHPMTDVHADEGYRRHLLGVLLVRALRMVGGATPEGQVS